MREMKLGGLIYRRVKSDFSRLAKEYITYLTNDRSIPDGEREKIIAVDARVFLTLAAIYHDAETVSYLNDVLEKETKRLTGHNKAAKKDEKESPLEIKPPIKELTEKETQDAKGFRPLEDVLTEFGIDHEIFAYVAKNTGTDIKTVKINNSRVDVVSDLVYEKVKKYIGEIRSR
ncbi:hypothetical protein HYU07_05795 [Candidatus Woesearchaeota archaeon]|nr:hypothetical protein [Candidatus Woesearchaeota archaeon]